MIEQFQFWVFTSRKKKTKNTNLEKYPLFTVAKTWKQPKCPLTNEWIKKIGYIHSEMLFNRRKNIVPFMTAWTDLEAIKLSETEKRQMPYNLTYTRTLKKKQKTKN